MVKVISAAAEEVQDFIMLSKFGPAVAVVGTVALFGFGGPALVSFSSYLISMFG